MDINLTSFPIFFQESFKEYNLNFPKGTNFIFNSFGAYRIVFKNRSIDTSNININREDFRSNMEQYHLAPNHYSKLINRNKENIEYYSTSFDTSKEEILEKMSYIKPIPIRKNLIPYIIFGYIASELGPCLKNRSNSHVHLWAYENLNISSFKIVNDY